jgi:protein-tyrosine phosphatase
MSVSSNRVVVFARKQFGGLAPVRAWRAARARRVLEEARSILFVCKGNICRSPFAEGYARAALGDRARVSSAGYDGKSGKPSPPDARTVARELGVDLEAHRARPITDELVREFDAIIVFDVANYDNVVGRFPWARAKVHRLGYVVRTGLPDIRDPYDRGVEEFRLAYGRIAQTLDAAIRR